MGGLISIIQASERPDTAAGLVLVDPALPPDLRARPDPRVFATFAAFLVPVVGRRVLSRRRGAASAEDAAHSLLRLCCVDPSRVPSDVVDLHVELAGTSPRVPRRRLGDARRGTVPDVGDGRSASLRGDATLDRRAGAAPPRRSGPTDQHRLGPSSRRGEPVLAVRGRAGGGSRPAARGPAVDRATWSSGGSPTTRRPPTSPPRRDPSSRTGVTMERLSSLDAGFLDLENDRQQMHVGSLLRVRGAGPGLRGVHGSPRVLPRLGSPVPPAGAADAAGPRAPGVGGRPALLAGLPPAAHRDPVARWRRAAARPRRPSPVPAARRRPAAVGESGSSKDCPRSAGRSSRKTHHAMIDGLAGNELMELVLDRDRDARRRPPLCGAPNPQPSRLGLAASGDGGRRAASRRPHARATVATVRGFSSPGDAGTGRGRPRVRTGDRRAQRGEPDERAQRPGGPAPALGLGAG